MKCTCGKRKTCNCKKGYAKGGLKMSKTGYNKGGYCGASNPAERPMKKGK